MKRPNILYLVHRLPYPPDKGDRIRAFHLLRYLSRRANLHLASLADEPISEAAVTALKQYCQRVAVVRLGRWSRWLRALGGLPRQNLDVEGAKGRLVNSRGVCFENLLDDLPLLVIVSPRSRRPHP